MDGLEGLDAAEINTACNMEEWHDVGDVGDVGGGDPLKGSLSDVWDALARARRPIMMRGAGAAHHI